MAHTSAHAFLGRLPHALSMVRVLLVLSTYAAVLADDVPLFAVLTLLAVMTDILDGPLARAYGTDSRFGANVDTAADTAFYLSLPVWTWHFEPQVIVDHAVPIVLFGALYLLANGLSHWKFGALGVHNRLSRASGSAGVLFALSTIFWGFMMMSYVLLIAIVAADLAQRYGALLRASGWMGDRSARG